MRTAPATSLLLLFLCAAARADTLHLKEGGDLEGELVAKTSRHWVFRVRGQGGRGQGVRRFEAAEVAGVETDDPAAEGATLPFLRNRMDHASLEAEGGDGETEAAVREALAWLARHQSPGGYWDCDGFPGRCGDEKCTGPGYSLYDIGVTGLALLAFYGAGHTHVTGDYRQVVVGALKYLRAVQDRDGCFGPKVVEHYVYNHALATLAAVEGFAITGSPLLEGFAQKGVDFIGKARNPDGAWRYGVRPGDNDTSVTSWMFMALYSAKWAGLKVDEECFDGVRKFLDEMTDPKTGRVGYTRRGAGAARPDALKALFPAENTESLTAVGLLCRILMAEGAPPEPGSERTKRARDLCLSKPPRWAERHTDMYYWFYGSLALFQVGGEPWGKWRIALKEALLPHQAREGCAKGSWAPAGPWGRDAGRVYSTALCALALETYYRYGRVRRR